MRVRISEGVLEQAWLLREEQEDRQYLKDHRKSLFVTVCNIIKYAAVRCKAKNIRNQHNKKVTIYEN